VAFLVVPPPPFRGALLRRAAGLWLLLRAGIVVLGSLLDLAPPAQLVFLTAPAAGFLVLLVIWLTLFDARRRGEVLFLADLGVAPDALVLLALAPPLVAELVLRLVRAP
jgi:hypothetical protein